VRIYSRCEEKNAIRIEKRHDSDVRWRLFGIIPKSQKFKNNDRKRKT
jgi:hypothetical protein